MSTIVLGEATRQHFIDATDVESRERGDESGTTFCGPRLYSIVGAEDYISIEDRSITFMTIDGTKVGQYEVEIEMTLENYPSIKSSTKFQVTIYPCKIFEYTASVTPSEISYYLGAEDLTSFAYTFTQTNKCGYPETITVANGPDFLTHNESNKDFTISTDVRDFIGKHSVTVKSSIFAPNDYTLTTKTEH